MKQHTYPNEPRVYRNLAIPAPIFSAIKEFQRSYFAAHGVTLSITQCVCELVRKATTQH